MESVTRRTGIDVIGDVPWGTHFCQFYETAQDLIEILVPYFKEGLASNEFCMWVTSEPLKVDQATAALRAAVPNLDDYIDKGQIEILDYSQWYTPSGKFSAEEVLHGWVDKLKAAQERGYEGLRLTGNTFWLEKADWDDFTKYEETVNDVIGRYPMLAICTYSLQKCNAIELLDVVANHQFALIKRSGRWEIIEGTQHKKIKHALQETEERYRKLFETMNEGFIIAEVVTDGKGRPVDYRFLDVNPAGERFFGRSREEIVGHTYKTIGGANADPEWIDVLCRVALTGEAVSLDRYAPVGGHWVHLLAYSPRSRQVAAIFDDITERKLAEMALQEANEELEVTAEELRQQNDELLSAQSELREKEERFRALAENVPDQIMRFDRNLRLVCANPAVLRRTGLPLETLAGRTALEYGASPTAAALWEKVARDVLESGEPRRYEHTSQWHGETRILDTKIVPERDNDGSVRAVVAIGRDITERKRAEEALLASEQRYVTTLASIGDAVIATDIEGRITFMNAVAEELTGWRLNEASQKPAKAVFNIINENTRLEVDDPVTKVLENGAIVGLANHTVLIRRDGSEVAIDDSGAPIRDQNGDITGVVLVFRDITERKRLEDTLRKSEEKYRTAIDFTCDWETWLSPEGNYIYVSPSCERITGYSADTFLTDPEFIESIVHPEDRELFPRHLNNVDDAQPVDFRIIARNGEERWISHICQPVYGSDGRYLGRRASNRDITDQKRSEEAFRETRDYLENLLDHANAPIIVWNTSLNITRFNRAFERLTGLEAQDVLGKSLEVLFPERTREDSLAYIRCTQSGERWDAVEIPIQRTDGSVRTVLWNSANIYDKDRTAIVATMAQGQDITERKQMEMELLKARDELELKVQERTAELKEALEAAEESVKAKAAFLANMSHELRTPMNAVIGFSSLLLDDNLTKDQREYIEGIRKGGEALLAIINDILDFSRAEKDKIELEHQPFSLKHLIDESLDMVATQAGKKGLNLSQTINYGTPDTIIGDHGRLRQILVNLLTNSVKFTDKGDVSVSVSSKAVEGYRHQIIFKIKDTGIGIPQDKMNEIFKPFVQVERTLSRKRDGVGLGLAITKNLVELMGGTIRAESIPGQGATFHFTIQAETIPGKQLDFGRRDSGIASESFPGLKPMRILVAEDNPSNQRVLVEMLKRLGYRADAVADGREVVQALERQDYDLVLMDIKMPEMDGITATQVIRKLRIENGPKIVAITAFALEGDREKCLEAGMDDYIAKPVQIRELAEVLKKNQPSSAGP
ncbi:MAG: PAS domain S-box protein [Methanotrichaceae archaeon]|jgi:PAS domain S-box-containing protein